jgi:hypothetical protein
MPSTSAVVDHDRVSTLKLGTWNSQKILSSTRRRGADHDDLGIGRRRIRPHPISSATLFSKIMIANAGRNAVNSSNRSGTRHRKLRRARSHTPALPLTSAVTTNAGTADPRTFSSRAVSLRQAAIPARSTRLRPRTGNMRVRLGHPGAGFLA